MSLLSKFNFLLSAKKKIKSKDEKIAQLQSAFKASKEGVKKQKAVLVQKGVEFANQKAILAQKNTEIARLKDTLAQKATELSKLKIRFSKSVKLEDINEKNIKKLTIKVNNLHQIIKKLQLENSKLEKIISDADIEYGATWYDEAYREGGNKQMYHKSPEETPYYPMWQKIVDMLDDKSSIIELGCGPGQLAQMIIASGKNYVAGYDFSEEAIKLAKKNNPKHTDKFSVQDIYKLDAQADTMIACEVFEHLKEDLELLKNLKAKKVLFSVPSYDSRSHVRFFENREAVKKRYRRFFSKFVIVEFALTKDKKIFLVEGQF